MKCEYCGSNLSIEDEVCPYCGKENKFAKKHNSDMDKYEEEYESVKEEVISNSRRFNGFTARLTIIAILVALLASVLVARVRKYDILRNREEKLTLAHLDEHKAALDELIMSRDYVRVYYYFIANNLAYSDHLNDYHLAYVASEKYVDLLDRFYYLYREDSYYTPEESIDRIVYAYQYLNKKRSPEDQFYKERYYTNEEVVAYINDLADHCDLLIQGHFGLSEDDTEKFRNLSEAGKQVILEEHWKNEKQ